MTLLRESYLYDLWTMLLSVYEDSMVHHILASVGVWCNRQIDESRVLRVLCREGAVARAWPDSCLCRLLTWLVNLPGMLLHRLYTAFRRTFEDSFFARLAFEMGEETAIAQSWVIMLLWVIPFSRWNNAYSLMAFVLLLVLFHAGAMHRKEMRLDLANIGFYPLILFGAVFLGVLLSYAPSLSLRFLFYHISAALCVLVTVSAVRTEQDLKRLAAGGAVCVAVSGAYGIVQRLQGVEVNASYVDLKVNAGMPGRVESFFDNPNTFAEVLILLLPLVLALVLCSRKWWSRLAAAGIFVIGVAALGYDLFPGKLGRNRLCHGGHGVFVEAEADPGLCGAVRAVHSAAAHYHLESYSDHRQHIGQLHHQSYSAVSGGPGSHPAPSRFRRRPWHRSDPGIYPGL